MATAGRPADLSESAPEQDWIDLGFRRATRADYEAAPDGVLDVVINEHYGLVDFDRQLYWLTDLYIVGSRAGKSFAKIVSGIVDPEPTVKECCSCHEEKPLTEFSPQARGTYGVSGECKACHSDRVAFELREGKQWDRILTFERMFGTEPVRSVSKPGMIYSLTEEGYLTLVEADA